MTSLNYSNVTAGTFPMFAISFDKSSNKLYNFSYVIDPFFSIMIVN